MLWFSLRVQGESVREEGSKAGLGLSSMCLRLRSLSSMCLCLCGVWGCAAWSRRPGKVGTVASFTFATFTAAASAKH